MTTIAKLIEHTILAPQADRPSVHRVVAEAIEHGFASVCVNGVFVADVAKALHGSGVQTCAVVSFPLGAAKPAIKAIEATAAVKDGAREIDFVAHQPFLLGADVRAAKTEFLEISKAARAANPSVVIKVIIESALLLEGVSADQGEARIEAACRAARESGCDFVKTSTGFHAAGGASIEAVALMKKHSGGLSVKASGGIRTYEHAQKIIEAGADRLGCSASVSIVQEAAQQPGATA